MRRYIPFLILISAYSAPALAAECENESYAGVFAGYVYQETGELITHNPVVQGGHTIICDKTSFDIWSSIEITGDALGRRDGDEFAITVNRSESAGPLDLEFTASYFRSAPLGSEYDALELAVEASHSVSIGDSELSPFLRVAHWVGFGEEDLTFVNPGIRATLPVTDSWSLVGETAVSFEIANNSETLYGSVGVEGDLGNGWSMHILAQVTENVRPIFGVTLTKSW